MSETGPTKNSAEQTAHDHPLRFGRDRVVRKGDQLVVCSPADMPDWQVAENRKTAVIIADQVWCLTGKIQFRSGVRYILDPWPEYLNRIPGRTIRYDAEYVNSRDAAAAVAKWHAAGTLMQPLEPLFGFLSSRVKSGIEQRLGISARRATFLSLCVELPAFLAGGVLTWVLTYVSMRNMAEGSASAPVGPLGTMILLMLLLAADLIMRYASYLQEDLSPYGFCEWIFSRRAGSMGKSGPRKGAGF